MNRTPTKEGIPVKDLLMLAGCIAYFVLPTDIIPDFLPGVGYSDDLAALTMAFKSASHLFNATVTGKASEKARQIFGDNFDPELAARLVDEARKSKKSKG